MAALPEASAARQVHGSRSGPDDMHRGDAVYAGTGSNESAPDHGRVSFGFRQEQDAQEFAGQPAS